MQTPYAWAHDRRGNGRRDSRSSWFERLAHAVRDALTRRPDRSLENVKFTDSLERELLEREIRHRTLNPWTW